MENTENITDLSNMSVDELVDMKYDIEAEYNTCKVMVMEYYTKLTNLKKKYDDVVSIINEKKPKK